MEDIVPDLKSAIEITTALDRTESRREDENNIFCSMSKYKIQI